MSLKNEIDEIKWKLYPLIIERILETAISQNRALQDVKIDIKRKFKDSHE